MSESIIFRGTSIRYFDVRQGKEGGDVFCRIHLSSNWNEQVRNKMDWEAIPDSVTECKLTGSLLASHLILTPSDKLLKDQEIQFDIKSVEDFRLVSLKDDEGEIRGRELRFIVRTPKQVAGHLEEYLSVIGRHEAALKVSYVKQENLPLEETKAANSETNEDDLETSCISCNNKLPFEDAAKSIHANGMKCTRDKGGSTLASAREAAGGTHARARRQTEAAAGAAN